MCNACGDSFALWPSAGYGFCDGGDTNNAEVDAHARGGLGIAQDFGMAGPAAGPPAHMYGAIAQQDSKWSPLSNPNYDLL